ncbi:related to esterase [Cephalotrichum gorgonifer]|uniref:Carboxylic ester hydrolase n=1 Tax=Cephalotrichum gorgonifer TaxID=2041049 RepID=A0AAE8N5D6_9PEZI|nr:related to esterase [Cephalotrichum gorgonifer]
MAPARTWLAVLSAAAALFIAPASTGPTAMVPRSEDLALSFIDELVANLTEAAETENNQKRSLTCSQDSSRTVNLLYGKYQGYYDEETDLNIWKGIRYAVPPTGDRRWQPPSMPALNLAAPVTQATEFGSACPQNFPSVPGVPFIPGNEDCLFLNVFAPPNAKNLPVVVWIHGGGYGLGDGTQDMSAIINENGKEFIAVTIQYRLNVFGFLSSSEVKTKGAVNAGILDQALALAWVKLFICQFGGDPTRVTISGESAGGSSVMYHGLAVGGSLGTLLFNNAIAASPYLPFQYAYDADYVTSQYDALAEGVGCAAEADVFGCLQAADSVALQQASHDITQSQLYGLWAFYPVTDNAYIKSRAADQLSKKKVNGKNMLVGNVANEGPLFVPPTITNEADLTAWLAGYFPNLSAAQIQSILDANPNDAPTNPSGPRFETDGLDGATAVEVSGDANGQQQRANNILAEQTFVCPSYWMADAWTGSGRKAWHFQYSVPFSSHGADVAAYFGPTPQNLGDDMAVAFKRIWGNFITGNNPSIANEIANGAAASDPTAENGASAWPVWAPASPQQVNLNQTGGVAFQAATQWGTTVTQFANPGLQNAITVVPADEWEGGRGARCAFWKGLTPSIPA